jgi:hypothetical protein
MALYMQGPYRKFNYPVHVGKPAALVNAQMSQDVNRTQPVRINPIPAPTYNTTSSFPTATTTAARPAVSGEGYYESSYSAPSLDVDSSEIWERAEAAMVRFMCLTSGQWRQKTDGLRHGQK